MRVTTTTKVLDYLTHSPRVARVLSLFFLTNCANHYREKMSQHDIRPESLHNLSVRFAVNATLHCPPPDVVLVQFRTTFAILMLIYVRKIPDPYNLSAPCEPFVGIQSFVMNGSFWHLLLPASPSRTFLIIQLGSTMSTTTTTTVSYSARRSECSKVQLTYPGSFVSIVHRAPPH